MNNKELKQFWKNEEQKTIKGWDFSYLTGRWSEESLPWNYKAIIEKYIKDSDILLDMGTGGGEFLLSLNHPYDQTYVTEGWEPNIELCKNKLSPLGIKVHGLKDNANLPYKDNYFDIILNKHSSYEIDEVYRILKPNGIFISQQVGGKNNNELSKLLIDNYTPKDYYVLEYASKELENASFNILYSNEYFPYVRFYDIGALVYFAKIIVWEFPNFSVDKCFDKLLDLHKEVEKNKYIDTIEHRLIFVAQKI